MGDFSTSKGIKKETRGDLSFESDRFVLMSIQFLVGKLSGLEAKKFPEETLTVFVEPPHINELIKRLKNRKTESQDKINMRIAKAPAEMANAPQFDVRIMNDDLATAKAEAEKIVAAFLGIEKK